MATSLTTQPNKPTFVTSDFAVLPVDPSEFIDAAAEETCPAETVPMSEPRAADAEALSAATLEVMDQLKALAQNVTPGNRASLDESDASDESNASSVQSSESEDASTGDPGGSQAAEPSISVFPRPTGLENNPVITDRPKFGRHVLTLAGLAVAALIGVGGTFAWQDHLKSSDVAPAVAPAPVAAAPVIPPYLGRQLEELSQDISAVRRRMEELVAEQKRLAALQQQFEQLAAKQQTLAAKQDQAGQSIVKLQALEQARPKTPAPVQYRPVPVPPPPVQSTMPPPPPQTAAHPVPPLPVPQR